MQIYNDGLCCVPDNIAFNLKMKLRSINNTLLSTSLSLNTPYFHMKSVESFSLFSLPIHEFHKQPLKGDLAI